MKKLNPKAVWLFFIGDIIALIFLYVFAGVFFGWAAGDFIRRLIEFYHLPSFLNFFLSFNSLYRVGFFILIGLSYIWARITYNNYKYELKEEGLWIAHGVISKHIVTIPYDRIQNVDVTQGPLSRLLGVSDLSIQTAGMSVSMGSSGTYEGRLPGISLEEAEYLRKELIARAHSSK